MASAFLSVSIVFGSASAVHSLQREFCLKIMSHLLNCTAIYNGLMTQISVMLAVPTRINLVLYSGSSCSRRAFNPPSPCLVFTLDLIRV